MRTLLALLLSALSVSASTFYVDYSTGNDANNGTTQSTPFKHIPGDPSATGNSAAVSGATGSVYLKGGVVYALATSAGITIDNTHYSRTGPLLLGSGIAVGWGNGTPLSGTNMPAIDGAGVANWILLADTMTNFTIRGLEMRTTLATPTADVTAVTLQNSVSNVVDSCILHDFGTNAANANQDAIGPYNNNGVFPTYHTITNCTIYNVTQKAIEPYRAGFNTIVNNTIWNCRDHGIVLTSDGNKVFGNIIYNISTNIYLTTGTSPSYGIKCATGTGGLTSNSNLVYNNVIAHCHEGGINIDNGEGGGGLIVGNLIANNTLIDIDHLGSYGAGIRFDTRNSTVNGTLVYNNIICSEAASSNDGSCPTPISVWGPCCGVTVMGNTNIFAYNLYFGQNASTHPGIYVSGTEQCDSWANFADTGTISPDHRFKVASAGTGNSFVFGNQIFDTDPKFKNYPTDLSLLSTSSAKAAGTNLSAWFTTDINGTTRSHWSMGAFEFVDFLPTITNVTLLLK